MENKTWENKWPYFRKNDGTNEGKSSGTLSYLFDAMQREGSIKEYIDFRDHNARHGKF